jgi:hypothetical protein
MICTKLSIGFLLLRISFKKIHTWILYLAMLTSVVAGGAFFFVTVFQCWPVYRFWAEHSLDHCVSNGLIVGLAYTYSIFSIISDFTFAIIPGFLVWDLQLKRRAKIALIPLITMGCIASAAVIARLPFVKDFNSPDFLCKLIVVASTSFANMYRGHHRHRHLVDCRTRSGDHSWQPCYPSATILPRNAPAGHNHESYWQTSFIRRTIRPACDEQQEQQPSECPKARQLSPRRLQAFYRNRKNTKIPGLWTWSQRKHQVPWLGPHCPASGSCQRSQETHEEARQ